MVCIMLNRNLLRMFHATIYRIRPYSDFEESIRELPISFAMAVLAVTDL